LAPRRQFASAAGFIAATSATAAAGAFMKRHKAHTARCASTASSQTLASFTIQGLGGGTREKPTEGKTIELANFVGKVTLIENVAAL